MKPEEYNGNFRKDLLDQYKLYVEMSNHISERRNKSNYFYISILSGLLATISLIFEFEIIQNFAISLLLLLFIAILSIFLCITWMFNIRSYKQLNSVKFDIIFDMEELLPFECFKREWEITNKKKYTPLTKVEQMIPILFVILNVVLVCSSSAILIGSILY